MPDKHIPDFAPKRVRLRDDVPVLLLVLWKILMPLASWLSRAYVSMWLHSRVTRIARVRRARLIGLARLATVGIFRIASLRPNGHCEILQLFPNQTQFVDDLFSYLIFHMAPFTFYISRGDSSFIKVTQQHYNPWVRDRQQQLEADLQRAWNRDPLVLLNSKVGSTGVQTNLTN